MARAMLNQCKIVDTFWKEVIYTTLYISNKKKIRVNNKTPYKLWKGRSTSVKYFKVFRRKCYIRRDEEGFGKFHSRSDVGIFLGYSTRSKAYKCYNKRLHKLVESANVRVDEERNQKEIVLEIDYQKEECCKEEIEEEIEN